MLHLAAVTSPPPQARLVTRSLAKRPRTLARIASAIKGPFYEGGMKSRENLSGEFIQSGLRVIVNAFRSESWS